MTLLKPFSLQMTLLIRNNY